jgi:hypothetical protein
MARAVVCEPKKTYCHNSVAQHNIALKCVAQGLLQVPPRMHSQTASNNNVPLFGRCLGHEPSPRPGPLEQAHPRQAGRQWTAWVTKCRWGTPAPRVIQHFRSGRPERSEPRTERPHHRPVRPGRSATRPPQAQCRCPVGSSEARRLHSDDGSACEQRPGVKAVVPAAAHRHPAAPSPSPGLPSPIRDSSVFYIVSSQYVLRGALWHSRRCIGAKQHAAT